MQREKKSVVDVCNKLSTTHSFTAPYIKNICLSYGFLGLVVCEPKSGEAEGFDPVCYAGTGKLKN